MVKLGLCVFERKTTEVKRHSYHVISRVYIINMTDHIDVNIALTEVVFARFLHCNVILSQPPSILHSLEGSHYVQPTPMKGGAVIPLLQNKAST